MGLGLYEISNPLGASQAALKGAAQSYAAMTKKIKTETKSVTTTKEKKSGLGLIASAGAGALLGFMIGGPAGGFWGLSEAASGALLGAGAGILGFMG